MYVLDLPELNIIIIIIIIKHKHMYINSRIIQTKQQRFFPFFPFSSPFFSFFVNMYDIIGY